MQTTKQAANDNADKGPLHDLAGLGQPDNA